MTTFNKGGALRGEERINDEPREGLNMSHYTEGDFWCVTWQFGGDSTILTRHGSRQSAEMEAEMNGCSVVVEAPLPNGFSNSKYFPV